MNGCSISINDGLKQWSVDPKSIEELYPLLEKNYEVAGEFIIDNDSKKNHKLSKFKTQNGNSDSVQAPEAIVNFHTHPYSCYIGEETVWGWPSAEDMRETILFTQKGSVAHLVLAIEGVYVLQVNPCVIQSFIHIDNYVEKELINIHKNKKSLLIFNKLIKKITTRTQYDQSEFNIFFKNNIFNIDTLKQELKIYNNNGTINNLLLSISCDIFRGLIVLCLEVYFRATHRFRSYDINKENYMEPDDFLKFVNSFKLLNIFSKGKNIQGCGNLTCGGVPVFENRENTQQFNKYLDDYERTTGFYLVNNHGDTLSLHTTLHNLNKLFPYIKDLLIHCKPKCKDKYNSNKFNWKDNWFHLSLIPNLIEINNKKIRYDSKNLTGIQRFEFIKSHNHNLFLDGTPTFFYFSINGNCDHNNISYEMKKNDDDIDFNNIKEITIIGSLKCKWTKKLINLLKKFKIIFNSNIYNSIKEAITKANSYNKNLHNKEIIEYVPAVFIIDNNKEYYIGGYDSVEKIINNIHYI